MADKTYNGIQFPNKSSGQGRTPDAGFLRVYLKNGNIYVVDENANDTQLTGIAESDPVFMGSAASNITNTNISNWNTAYGWGDHATQGYLTSVALNDISNVTINTPSSGQVLSYNGSIWVNDTLVSDASVSASATAPASPAEGTLWWDVDIGQLFIYYNDGTSNQWVEAAPAISPFEYNSSTQTYSVSGTINATAFTGDGSALTGISVSTFDGQNSAYYLDYGNFSNVPTAVSAFTNDAGYITDYTVTQTDVTTHQGALSITESQISDLGSYLTQTTGDARYLQLSGGSISGNIAVTGTVDGRDLSADGTKLDGIETGADVTDANNVDPLVDAHLNTSTATTDQVLSWNGSDYDWVDQSGGTGGASVLDDLTDVAIASVADGDLLRYNGTASEWQNTNLGLTVTPTLSAPSTQYLLGTATITNWGTYQDPAVFAQLKNSGGTVVVTNDNITVDDSGNISFFLPGTVGTYTLEVQVQDFGDLASEVGTVNITKASSDFRYWRIGNFVYSGSSHVLIRRFSLFTGSGQTGTLYPPVMSDNNVPSPYVASAQGTQGPSYQPWMAFDDTTVSSAGWWNLGSSTPSTDYLQIDFGQSRSILSLSVDINPTYTITDFTIYASNTGAFGGEEVEIITYQNGVPISSVINIG